MCVAGAINNYTAQLLNYNDPSNTCKRIAIALYKLGKKNP